MTDITIICIASLVFFVFTCGYLCLKMMNNDIMIKSCENVISHKPVIGWITVFGGTLMFLFGVFALYAEQYNLDREALSGSIGCMIIGFIITTCMLPAMSSAHFILWTNDYIEGPNKMFGPTLAFSRKKILWNDIVKSGLTVTGYNYLQTISGDRIYWSTYSRNTEHFAQKLTEKLN